MLAGGPSSGLSQSSPDSVLSLVPGSNEVSGLIASDSARVFRGESLYRFIDGGADLFLEYGFSCAVAQEYLQPASITLEIYEMSDPAAAYGIYSVRSGSEGVALNLGQEARRTPYYLMFCKGRYYVSVAAEDTTPVSQTTVEAVARIVDRKIKEVSGLPAILGLMPEEGLVKKTYFRGILGLSTIYTFDTKEIFHAKEGASARYKDCTLIVFAYQDTTAAIAALAAVESDFRSNARFRDVRSMDRAISMKDRTGRSLCSGRRDRFLVVTIASSPS